MKPQIFILPFAIAALVYAHETDSTIVLEEVKVTETRGVKNRETISKAVIEVPRSARTVDELLSQTAGIDLNRSSAANGKGGKAVLLRGMDDSRVQILLNGRPLNGTGVMSGQYVDWASLSSLDVEKIEVIRGSKNAEYGSAVGGVINIVTKKPVKEDRTSVTGTFGITPRSKSDPFEQNSFSVGVSPKKSIGDFAFLNLYGEYWKNDEFLRNNWANRGTFGGDLSLYLPADITAKIGTRWSIHNRGFAIANDPTKSGYNPDYPVSLEDAGGGPGLTWAKGKYFGDHSYWHNVRSQHDLSIEKQFETVVLTAQAWLQDQDRQEFFYAQDDTAKLVLERQAKPEALTGGWKIGAKQSIGEQLTLNYGTDMIWGRNRGARYLIGDSSYFAKQPVSPSDTTASTDYTRNGGWVQAKADLWEKRITLDGGVRGDYQKNNKDTLSSSKTVEGSLHGVIPNLSALLSFWKGGTVTVSGAYVNRFPTQPEYSWYYNGFIPENRAELSQEKAVQAELGIAQEFGDRASLAARGYYYSIEDYLVSIFGYKPSRVVYNIGKVNMAGLEVEGSLMPISSLKFWGNMTYLGSKKEGDVLDMSNTLTDELTEIPKIKGNIGVQFTANNKASAGLTVRMCGEQEAIVGNSSVAGKATLETVDGFTTVGVNGSYPIVQSDIASITVKASIEKLFDVEYSERYGFPMPGISGTVGITAEF